MDRLKLKAGLITAMIAMLGAIFFVNARSVGAADTLPNSGTYFITNSSSGEALQPNGPTVAQNVFTEAYNKGGMQKWTITRLIDPKTKQPTNRYNIFLAGDTPGLNFQPSDYADHTSMILPDKSVMVLEPLSGAFLIKSVKRNGDALYIYPSPPGKTEARFGPSDSSAKFQWNFESAN